MRFGTQLLTPLISFVSDQANRPGKGMPVGKLGFDLAGCTRLARNFLVVVTIAQWHASRERIVPSICFLRLTEEAPMVFIHKTVGVLSCGFVLCLGLSHAAPASAADKMKGDDMRAAETDKKGGQAGMKGEEDKTKRVDNAGKPSEKKKEIKQNEMGEIKK